MQKAVHILQTKQVTCWYIYLEIRTIPRIPMLRYFAVIYLSRKGRYKQFTLSSEITARD